MNLRQNARRVVATGIVAASAALGAALPAQAVTSHGCTATPLTPTYGYTNAAGQKVLRYTVRLTCSGLRSVVVQHQIREQDLFTSQLIKNSTFARSFPVAGTQTISFYSTVPDTEPGAEEMYHRLRIKVTVAGIPTPWSAWDSSAVVSV